METARTPTSGYVREAAPRRPLPVVLRCRGLEAGYGDLGVLWNVSLEVRRGELVALVGANGSGKSTTLRAICGEVRPRAGEITFQKRRVDGLHPGRLARLGLAHVPEGRGLFPDMTVRDNLLLGVQVAGRVPRRAIAATLEWVYGLFPVLRERSRQPAGSLSGGEQQMLAIGRALIAKPELLVLDEPSLGLAPRAVAQVFRTLAALRSAGTTILLVEQNVRQALALADWAYVLDGGRIVAEGPGSDLLGTEIVRRVYLGL